MTKTNKEDTELYIVVNKHSYREFNDSISPRCLWDTLGSSDCYDY